MDGNLDRAGSSSSSSASRSGVQPNPHPFGSSVVQQQVLKPAATVAASAEARDPGSTSRTAVQAGTAAAPVQVQVTVAMVAAGNASYRNMSLVNKRLYAARRGYQLFISTNSTEGQDPTARQHWPEGADDPNSPQRDHTFVNRDQLKWAWQKIEVLQELMQQKLGSRSISKAAAAGAAGSSNDAQQGSSSTDSTDSSDGSLQLQQELDAAEQEAGGFEQWILMIDLDAFILTMATRVEDIIADARAAHGDAPLDLILACDGNGMQTGVFLLRVSLWSEAFLQKVHQAKTQPIIGIQGLWEQAAMNYLLNTDIEAAQHVQLVQQRVLNAYRPDVWGPLSDDRHQKWRPGDFIMHLVDYSKKRMEAVMKLIQDTNRAAAGQGSRKRRVRKMVTRRRQMERPGGAE
jgi:hypothetical protein